MLGASRADVRFLSNTIRRAVHMYCCVPFQCEYARAGETRRGNRENEAETKQTWKTVTVVVLEYLTFLHSPEPFTVNDGLKNPRQTTDEMVCPMIAIVIAAHMMMTFWTVRRLINCAGWLDGDELLAAWHQLAFLARKTDEDNNPNTNSEGRVGSSWAGDRADGVIEFSSFPNIHAVLWRHGR